MKQIACVVAGALLLTGCSLAPTYQRPQSVTAQSWASVQEGQASAAQIPWKSFFHAKELQTVVETALANNRDLKTAVLNVRKTQELYRIERADLLPQLNGSGSGEYRRDFHDNSTESYNVGLAMASYEVDLFGRVQNLSDAALATYLATDEARKSVTIALIAQAASSWLQLTSDQQTLALTRESLASREETYAIVKKSYDNGVATRQDLSQARMALESARVNTIRYARIVQLDKNALVSILGTRDLTGIPLSAELKNTSVMEEIPVGLPSEVLLNRPDILQAEFKLKAAGANIGAARAAFYPRIALTGSLGYSSTDLGNLISSDNAGIGIGPSISIPIFNAGRNKALLKAAEIDQEMAVVAYEKTLQDAFKEVADALAARETLGRQLSAQGKLVEASLETFDLAMKRYNEGLDSFLNVLDAQRSLFDAQTAEIDLQRQELANRVTLYKVLGGGLTP